MYTQKSVHFLWRACKAFTRYDLGQIAGVFKQRVAPPNYEDEHPAERRKEGGHPLIEATALFVASLIVDGVYGVLGQSASTAV